MPAVMPGSTPTETPSATPASMMTKPLSVNSCAKASIRVIGLPSGQIELEDRAENNIQHDRGANREDRHDGDAPALERAKQSTRQEQIDRRRGQKADAAQA